MFGENKSPISSPISNGFGVRDGSVEERIPEVADQLRQLDNAMGDIQEQIKLLSSRLKPVLRPELPVAETKGQMTSVECQTEVSETIRRQVSNAAAAVFLLSDLRNRLEV